MTLSDFYYFKATMNTSMGLKRKCIFVFITDTLILTTQIFVAGANDGANGSTEIDFKRINEEAVSYFLFSGNYFSH